jgi:hypothetical protein
MVQKFKLHVEHHHSQVKGYKLPPIHVSPTAAFNMPSLSICTFLILRILSAAPIVTLHSTQMHDMTKVQNIVHFLSTNKKP